MKKRYMIFAFYGAYPSGGMNDFESSFDTSEEFENAKKEIDKECDFYQIADTETGDLLEYRFYKRFGEEKFNRINN